MRVFAFVIGSLGTLAVLGAIVDGMLITRASRSRLGKTMSFVVLALAKLPLRMMSSYVVRDRWLTGVAPVSLLLQLSIYALLLIFTLGLMVWGATDLDWGNSLYQSGSTFTTLGIVEPVNVLSTVVTFIAAFLGLVVIAIFIGFLMGIFSMYNDRENLMARLAAVAGEPAWGPQVLARSAVIGSPLAESINSADWLDWTIQVRTNTLINPTFGLFRSTSSQRHWVISQLAVLDAVSLKLAIDPANAQPIDIQMLSGGAVTFGVLTNNKIHNWQTEEYIVGVLNQRPAVSADIDGGLSADEWARGWNDLVRGNIVSAKKEEEIRHRFFRLRELYVQNAYSLARQHNAVRAPWSGQRRFDEPVLFPERASDPTGMENL
jgi:hypothetical protein